MVGVATWINLGCVYVSRICMLVNLLAFNDPEIEAFIRMDEQTDMARSAWLLILINNIIRFLTYMRVTYIFTNLAFYSTSNGYNKDSKIFKRNS